MCGSFATQTASCVNNTWMMSISSCNPPPPPITTCPTIAPITGGYCDYAGAPCHYDYCNLPDPCVCWDNRMTATCSGNQWTVEAMCDPPLPDGGTRIPQDAGAD
jgi:hypothetical protein